MDVRLQCFASNAQRGNVSCTTQCPERFDQMVAETITSIVLVDLFDNILAESTLRAEQITMLLEPGHGTSQDTSADLAEQFAELTARRAADKDKGLSEKAWL